MAKINFDIVKVEHIEAALKFIDANGVAKGQETRTQHLVFEGKEYPSKYVFAVAYKFAINENPLDATSLTNEYSTNRIRPVLEKLGFEVGYSTEEDISEIAKLQKDFDEHLKTALDAKGKPMQDNSKKQGLAEFKRDFTRLGYIDQTDSLFELFDSLSTFDSLIEKVRKEPNCEHLFMNGDPIVGYHLYRQFFIQLDQDSKKDEVAKFKKLLEWFVGLVRSNNDIPKKPEKYANIVGYKFAGQRAPYAEWRSFNGFNLDCTIMPGRGKNQSGSNYINLEDTWVNVVPRFISTNGKSDVGTLIIVIKPDNIIIREHSEQSIESLGLFDGNHPNDEIKAFFDALKKEIEIYQKDNLGNNVEEENGEMANTKQQFAKNMILYGPPGTGKTYNTAIYAVAIADDRSIEQVEKDKYETIVARYNELKKEGRIAFTTFHQSYSYEEFIEGIRPKLDDASELLYELRAGVFKNFCNEAKKHSIASPIGIKSDAFDDGFDGLLDEIANSPNGEIIITSKAKKPLKLILQDNGDGLYIVTQNNKFSASRTNVRNRYLGIPSGAISLRAYWDAIVDYIVSKTMSSKVEHSITDEAAKRQNYIFIIDEINRGNPSRIFGELITLIEDTKRLGEKEAMTAILPYSNTEFGIPSNIYILGTMNTADRSIALLDTALRRRFDFVEMQPRTELLDGVVIDGIEIGAMLSKINERIAALLDRDHTIGHAYFMPLRNKVNPTINDLAEIMKNKIIPLLQEYFYDDYEKIRLVLGDNQKEDFSLQFVIKLENRIQDLFGNYDNDLIDRYKINDEAFAKKEAYGKIK